MTHPVGDRRLPIWRRWLALTAFAAVGGVTFLPFLAAGTHRSPAQLLPFAVGVTLVASLVVWPGLRCADATGLPMPLLRRLDGAQHGTLSARALGTTLLTGVGVGVVGRLALRLVDAPRLPGTTAARALSALFASGPLEMVLHLGIMSIVVWVARGRRGPGVVVAALLLVAFHLTGGALAQPGRIIAVIIIGNGVIGVALGLIYAAYGFECVVIGHIIAHLLTVLGAG